MNSKNYYFLNGTSQEGPFSLEEIIQKPLSSDTLIWKEGDSSWRKASEFPEFVWLNKSTPPPIPPQSSSTPTVKQRSSWAKKVFKFLLLAFIGVALVLIFFRINTNHNGAGETYLEKKLSVKEVEESNPGQFLETTGTYNEAIFSNKIKIHGKVTNKASVANFKDIRIAVTYYSATKSRISVERFVLYDFVPAHSTKSFEWKINPPSGTETIGWDTEGAVPY